MKPEEFKRRMDKVYHDMHDKLKIEVANNFKSLRVSERESPRIHSWDESDSPCI